MEENWAPILQTVSHIIENDYAGWPECQPRNKVQSYYEVCADAQAAGTLDSACFARIMTQYVAGFQDQSLQFKVSEESGIQVGVCGFSVRRFGEELYVVQVGEDKRFTVGDALVLLDQRTPDSFLAAMPCNVVGNISAERQRWDGVVALCSEVTVRQVDGHQKSFTLQKFPKPRLTESLHAPQLRVIEGAGHTADQRAVVLSPHHFVNGSVLELLQTQFSTIAQAQRMIIDLRDIQEGMIGNAYGILALFFNREVNLKDLMGQTPLLTRYTKLNAQMRLQQLGRMLARSDAAGKGWVQAEIDHVHACAGQGFVEEAEFEEDMVFPPAPAGMQVFLLTDVFTSGPGERLVAIAQQAARQGLSTIRCVGRATQGGLDYSNLISLALDKRFSLVYPISKTKAAHQGQGTKDCGLAPHVQIPFTPEECHHDVVLEKALSL